MTQKRILELAIEGARAEVGSLSRLDIEAIERKGEHDPFYYGLLESATDELIELFRLFNQE